jgi:type I restriction enzyme S subunit
MPKVLLGDVAHERKETCKVSKDEYPIVGLEHLISGEITLKTWDEGSDNSFTKMFRKGNVLFGRRRAYLKKAAVAPFDGICSGDITVIEADSDRILPELLPFIIQNDSLFEFAVGKSAGSLSPRVKWEYLKNYEFELPNMDKQKELAELLWAIDATKKSYQELILATDELIKSQFMELFGKRDTIALKSLASISAGQSSPHDEEFSENGIPFIKAGDLEDLKLNRRTERECHLVSDDVAAKKKLKLQKTGTVLVAKSGMSCLSGHIYALKEPAYVVSHLACINPIDGKSTTEFIRGFFLTVGIAELIKDISYPSIQLTQFGEMEIPDVDIQEQLAFSSYLRQSDKSKFEIERALSELNATYKSIITENLG